MKFWKWTLFLEILIPWLLTSTLGMPRKYPRIVAYHTNINWTDTVYFQLDTDKLECKNLTFHSGKSLGILAASCHAGIFCRRTDISIESESDSIMCHREEGTVFYPEFPRRNIDEIIRRRVIELNPYGDHLVWQDTMRGGLFVTNLRSNTSFFLLDAAKLNLFAIDWNNGIIYMVFTDNDKGVYEFKIPKLSQVDKSMQRQTAGPLPISTDSISGLACASDPNETVYWLSYESLFRKTANGTIETLITNFDYFPSIGSLQFHDGFLYWFQKNWEVSMDRSLVIFDTQLQTREEKPLDFQNRLLSELIIYEDRTGEIDNACEKLSCSHICLPMYKSSFQCICPWGLKLVNETQCTGIEIVTLTNTQSSEGKNYAQVTSYDLSIGKNESHKFECNRDTSNLLRDQDKFSWVLTKTNFTSENTTFTTKYSSSLRPAEPSFSFFLRLKPVHAYSSSVQEHVHFSINGNGCLIRHDLSASTLWTLTCLHQLGGGQAVLDVDRWILFWEDEDKNGFQTKLITNKTRRFNFFEPSVSRGREPSSLIALDSHEMKVYLLSFLFLNVTDYRDSIQSTVYRTLKTDGNTFSNLIFSAGRLYWIEHFDNSRNDYIVTFDPVYEVKERILMSTGLTGFKVLHEQAVRIPNVCETAKCSHFCAPTKSGSLQCFCPPELPILKDSSMCTSPKFLVATQEGIVEEKTELHLINANPDVIIPFSFPQDLLNARFSAMQLGSNVILCRTVPAYASNQISCDTNYSTETLTFGLPTEYVEIMALGPRGDIVFFQTRSNGCIHVYSLILEASFLSVCVREILASVLTFVIDTRRHVIFWCDRNNVRYMALSGIGNATLIETKYTKSVCHSVTVNEYNAELIVLMKSSVILIEYSMLRVLNRREKVLHEITYKYHKELQYYADNIFWIGGMSQPGEFIESFAIKRNVRGEPIGSVNFQRLYSSKGSNQILQFQILESSSQIEDWPNPCEEEMKKCDTVCLIKDPIPPSQNHAATCLFSKKADVTTNRTSRLNQTSTTQEYRSPSENNSLVIISTTVAFLCALFVIILGSVVFFRIQKAKKTRFEKAVADLVKGDLDAKASVVTDPETAALAPFTMTIPPEQIELNVTNILGTGNFGMVYSGRYNEMDVALKTVKCGTNVDLSENLLVDFIRELKVMAYIGKHENVVTFYGAEISGIQDGKAFAVMELSPHGSLKTHLESLAETQTASHYYVNVPRGHQGELDLIDWSEDCKLMLSWTRQIASGMCHLEEKRIVHGDLATRNILVFDGGQKVKLTDFGLSRNLYKSDYYKKHSNAPLPFRWSAIEILEKRGFSTKADAWSYGVTIWEIFSFGALPFAEFEWDAEFVPNLRAGLRLPKPNADLCQVYEKIMMPCWELRALDRPSFSALEQVCLGVLQEKQNELDTRTSISKCQQAKALF